MPKIKISTVKFTKGRVFVLSFFAMMLLAIPTTIYLVGQQLQTSTIAEKSTTLAFNPVTKSASPGEKVSFDIVVTPGTNAVNYIKLAIKYDSTLLSTDEKYFAIDPASKLKLTEGPTVASGSVVMVLTPVSPTDTITTESKLGNITFLVNSVGSDEAKISFDSAQTQIRSLGSADGVLENVFLNGTPASITIEKSGDTSGNANTSDNSDSPVVSSPTSNETISDQTPAFEGKAKPNSTVTITIHSTQSITAKVTTDANGNWTYTPTTKLASGSHTITISATDSNGILKTITQTFSVLADQAQAAGAETSTPICSDITSDIAANGSVPYTIKLTATGSDEIAKISKVTFNFGDGGKIDLTQGGGIGTSTVSATATHTYQTSGAFNATAVLTNSQGTASDPTSCTLPITITGSSTSAALSPLPKTGPSPVIVGIGALGGIILLIGALFFFVL